MGSTGPWAGVINRDGKDTQEIYAQSPTNGAPCVYSQEREKLHHYLIECVLEHAAIADPPTVIFLAGGSGSGKSSLIHEALGEDISDYAYIDPDRFKFQIPEFDQRQNAGHGDAAEFVHEESSHLAKQALDEAIGQGLLVVYDTTFSNAPFFEAKLSALKALGCHVAIYFADCPLEMAQQRVADRATTTGRTVPVVDVKRSHRQAISTFNSLKGLADCAYVFDMSGEKEAGASLVLTYDNGQETVLEPDIVPRLRANGHEIEG